MIVIALMALQKVIWQRPCDRGHVAEVMWQRSCGRGLLKVHIKTSKAILQRQSAHLSGKLWMTT